MLDEVTEELGRGVEHLVAQLTLMVDAFLCKKNRGRSVILWATPSCWKPRPAPDTPGQPSMTPWNQSPGRGSMDAETHHSSRCSSLWRLPDANSWLSDVSFAVTSCWSSHAVREP